MKLLALLLAASLQAATIINPPPEGDTLAIVSSHCPSCVRVSDAEDIDFSAAEGYYVFAFEDWHNATGMPLSDFDYNDLIVEATFAAGALDSWAVIASYTAAQDAFGYDGVHPFITAIGHPYVAQSWSAPWLNSDGLDHMASWTLPADPAEAPEPGTLGLLLIGLGLLWRRK